MKDFALERPVLTFWIIVILIFSIETIITGEPAVKIRIHGVESEVKQ